MPKKKSICMDCGARCSPKAVTITPRYRSCKNKNYWENTPYTRKEYAREWQLKKKYDVDNMGFEVLWIAFKGRCGICNNELKLSTSKRGQSLDVVTIDHDHKTGNLRGLLCNGCNKGLGLFKDKIEYLQKAKEYLELCQKEKWQQSEKSEK